MSAKFLMLGIILSFSALQANAQQQTTDQVKPTKVVSKESKPMQKKKAVKKDIKIAPSKTIYREKVVKTK